MVSSEWGAHLLGLERPLATRAWRLGCDNDLLWAADLGADKSGERDAYPRERMRRDAHVFDEEANSATASDWAHSISAC